MPASIRNLRHSGGVTTRTKLIAAALAGILALFPAAALAETTIVTSNSSDDTETKSGDADASNSGSAFVGHQGGGSTDVGGADITSGQATNVQEGDNDLDADQSATASTGDTVGGQVIGAVTDDALSVDATNLSEDIEATSGDADADNTFDAFVGLSAATGTSIGAADIVSGSGTNVQEGDNDADVDQFSQADTGAAVGGQVFGAVAGGPSDIVLANTSTDAETESGDSDQDNDSDVFTGLAAAGIIDI
jgi:hypothetical protein